ncbi:MAG: hypothetical protein KDA33_02755 [Phycisphaerales bacterium]|nr:hypothetical protein [Phycisphaerales bacterium]
MIPAATPSISTSKPPSIPNRWLFRTLLGLAVAALLARDGRGASALPTIALIACQVPLILLWIHHLRRERLSVSTDGILFGLVALAGVGLAVACRSVMPALVATTGYIVGATGLGFLHEAYRKMDAAIETPDRLIRVIVPYWIGAILVGAILLSMPIATQSGVPDYRHNFVSHVVGGLHTSTSAACLVGVFTLSFGEDYTSFGQIVIIGLTQLAGFAFCAMGLSLIRPILQRPATLKRVFVVATLIQLTGVAVLLSVWRSDDTPTFVDRIWWSIVHAGGALWNTGVVMRADGLAGYFADRRVFLAITSLAIAGSLGVPLLLDLLGKRPPADDLQRHPLSGLATFDAFAAFLLLLLMSGALVYLEHPASWVGEWRPALPFEPSVHQPAMRDDRSRPWPLAVLVASTVRSAGLQTIPVSVGTLSWPSFGLIIGAMFTGGSVAGTAGGIRTSLFGLLILTPIGGANVAERARRGAFRRQLLARFGVGLGAWLAMNFVAALLLGTTTSADRYDTTFDAIASLNNVGLTTGLVDHLTTNGRLVAIALMLVGRFWPLWFWAGVMRTIRQQAETAAQSRSL